MPRSRNKEGEIKGGVNAKKGSGAGGIGTPVAGATPAVGGAQTPNGNNLLAAGT